MKLSFYGATGTVTGSKYLLETGGLRLLIDAGLFQGFKQLRLRNWAPPPFDPNTLDAVILTHAHIDHSGYLPLLAKQGFRGKVYCSHATRDLCGVLLPDAAHLQEEEARFANKHNFSRHRPALPLFDADDAAQALKLLKGTPTCTEVSLGAGVSFRLVPNGHMLGSNCVVIKNSAKEGEKESARSIVFSGDLGRSNDPVMKPPQAIAEADWLVLESTYGDRLHPATDSDEALATAVTRAAARGGVVVIPAFAVGRAQTLLLQLGRLKQARRIPDIPVYLNSPMAVNATKLYVKHASEHRLTPAEVQTMCNVASVVNTPEESRRLNQMKGPMIIVSASGMATGGRVLHHIKQFAPDARNLLLFAGYQAGGTRGASIVGGADSVKIHGQYVPIRAEVVQIDTLSAHADYNEIIAWLRNFRAPPKQTFLVHGEPAATDGLRRHITEALPWRVTVPEYLETVTLT